jgi:hypothetical protein
MSFRRIVLLACTLSSTAACGDDKTSETTSSTSSSGGSSTSSSGGSSTSSSGSTTSGLICVDNESSPQWCKRFDPPPANYRPNCPKEVSACPATKVVATCTRAENPGSTKLLYDQDFYVLPATLKGQLEKLCEDAKGTFTETP